MRVFHVAVALAALCLFTAVPARAMELPTYTEESYVFVATDVVEATIGESSTVKDFTTVAATVDKVYKGGHKDADTLKLAALDFFRTRDDPKDLNSRKLAKGDKVLLFLVRAEKAFLFDVPGGQDILMALPGGLYTIKGDGIHTSAQAGNPGPYEDWHVMEMKPAEFRAHLQQEVLDMAKLEADIKGKKLPEEIDWFSAELKKRTDPMMGWYGDMISPVIARRIAETRDPALIVKAAVDSGGSAWQPVLTGLRFPQGREYLIAQITDPNAALRTRLLLARVLPRVGLDYYEEPGHEPGAATAPDRTRNHHLITRLAEVARQPGAPPELIECVLENLWDSYLVTQRARRR